MKHGCIVGVGAVGPIHARALKELGGLRAVCDNQPKRLAAFEPENTALRRYADFEQVLSDPEIEVVHICTPHYLHKEMTIAALAAGKHVILEKPVAMNAEELAAICRAEAEADGKLCIMLQNRFNPAVLRLKEFLETDASLGAVQGINAFLTWNRDADYYAADAWRGKWATEGGGLLINQAIHTIDLLGYLGGRIYSVTGSISNKTLRGVIEVEDTADAVFETQDGMRMCFYATNGCPHRMPAQLEVKLERGVLRYADNRLYRIEGDTVTVLTHDMQTAPGKSCWGSGHKTVIDAFYRSLEGEDGIYPTLQDAFPVMRTLFAFYQSAKTGETVLV